MEFPTYSIEDEVKSKGFKYVAGVDEVARGTFVGSVVAAAVVIPDDFITKLMYKVNDSKKLSPEMREELYDLITNNCDYGIGEISNEEIDRTDLFRATQLAMYKALDNLNRVDYALVDGNFVLDNINVAQQKQVIKGDCKRISIASASIVAKVTKEYAIPTVASLNPLMIDGTGMCGVCRVEVGGKTKFACVDGPEFDAHKVNFDILTKRNRNYAREEKIALEKCGGAK